jgi:hypothetical protein
LKLEIKTRDVDSHEFDDTRRIRQQAIATADTANIFFCFRVVATTVRTGGSLYGTTSFILGSNDVAKSTACEIWKDVEEKIHRHRFIFANVALGVLRDRRKRVIASALSDAKVMRNIARFKWIDKFQEDFQLTTGRSILVVEDEFVDKGSGNRLSAWTETLAHCGIGYRTGSSSCTATATTHVEEGTEELTGSAWTRSMCQVVKLATSDIHSQNGSSGIHGLAANGAGKCGTPW